jgi:hypothetical protein
MDISLIRRADDSDILKLSIYLIESSRMPYTYALAKEMAVSFPRITELNLWLERQCEILSVLLTINCT